MDDLAATASRSTIASPAPEEGGVLPWFDTLAGLATGLEMIGSANGCEPIVVDHVARIGPS